MTKIIKNFPCCKQCKYLSKNIDESKKLYCLEHNVKITKDSFICYKFYKKDLKNE